MPDSFQTFRDPLVSLFQSAVADVAKKIDEKAATVERGARSAGLQRSATGTLPGIAAAIAQREYNRARGEMSPQASAATPRELTKSGIAEVCAELGFRYMKALASGDDKAISQLKDEYTAGTCDVAWLTTLEEYRRYFDSGRRKPVPYIRPSTVGPATIEVKANARVALTGDWGTGAPPAIEVLRLIAGDKPDVLVHLGDIYYSGTPTECQTHFLNLINPILRAGVILPVFTLAGNHDMYCGGLGFYELIKQINAPPFTQPASFFCLRAADEKWQLLAMDTGLHDDNPVTVADALTYLEEDELAWHCDRIQEFGGRTIVLSHHQLFSAFSAIGPMDGGKRSATNPRLIKAFQRLTASKQIAAWFWGHEHTLSIYKPFAGLERGRCLGHSAVPVSVIDEIYKPLSNLEEAPALVEGTKLDTRGAVYAHGYALLIFQGDQCRTEYYQAAERGRDLVYQETFC